MELIFFIRWTVSKVNNLVLAMSAVKKNKARKDSRDQQGQEGTGLNFKKYVQMHMHDTLMYFKQVKCLIIKKQLSYLT